MKTNQLLLIIIISFFIISCNNKRDAAVSNNSDYSFVPFNELIELLKNNQVNQFQISYKDSLGNELSDSLSTLLNQGKLYREFYRDKNQQITQIRVKHLEEKNIFKEIQIRELFSNPFNQVNIVDINCNKIDSIIMDAFEKDQNVRKGIDVGIQNVDEVNQTNVISLIEKCGWPEKEELIRSIWYVIQHADSGLMTYYYPKFKELVAKGLLKESTMALMEDRMLMNNGFPQIYGSQIVQQNVYKFRDPININKRRAKVGLAPIEEYATRFGFEFKLEDYIDQTK